MCSSSPWQAGTTWIMGRTGTRAVAATTGGYADGPDPARFGHPVAMKHSARAGVDRANIAALQINGAIRAVTFRRSVGPTISTTRYSTCSIYKAMVKLLYFAPE